MTCPWLLPTMWQCKTPCCYVGLAAVRNYLALPNTRVALLLLLLLLTGMLMLWCTGCLLLPLALPPCLMT